MSTLVRLRFDAACRCKWRMVHSRWNGRIGFPLGTSWSLRKPGREDGHEMPKAYLKISNHGSQSLPLNPKFATRPDHICLPLERPRKSEPPKYVSWPETMALKRFVGIDFTDEPHKLEDWSATFEPHKCFSKVSSIAALLPNCRNLLQRFDRDESIWLPVYDSTNKIPQCRWISNRIGYCWTSNKRLSCLTWIGLASERALSAEMT